MKVKYSRFRHNARQTSFTARWWARACATSNKWWCHVRLKLPSPRKRLYLKFPINGGREATTGNTSALRRLNGSLFCHKKSFQVLSWQKLQRDTPTWTGTINYNCKRFSDYFRTGKLIQIKSNHSSRAIFLKCFKCSYFSTFTDDKIETQCLNFSCPRNYV